MEKIIWNRDIIEAWKKAIDKSNSPNPFSRSALRTLGESGITMLEIRTRLGMIMSKPEEQRHDDEKELLDFFRNVKLEFEQGLVDACLDSAQGSMFLLKTQYGYREGLDIGIEGASKGKNIVRSWGEEASGGDSEGSKV